MAILPNNERKVKYMEKGFHPVSGEVIYLATEKEKQIIDIALLHYLESTRSSQSGVIDG